jgi:hypothetical protein
LTKGVHGSLFIRFRLQHIMAVKRVGPEIETGERQIRSVEDSKSTLADARINDHG